MDILDIGSEWAETYYVLTGQLQPFRTTAGKDWVDSPHAGKRHCLNLLDCSLGAKWMAFVLPEAEARSFKTSEICKACQRRGEVNAI